MAIEEECNIKLITYNGFWLLNTVLVYTAWQTIEMIALEHERGEKEIEQKNASHEKKRISHQRMLLKWFSRVKIMYTEMRKKRIKANQVIEREITYFDHCVNFTTIWWEYFSDICRQINNFNLLNTIAFKCAKCCQKEKKIDKLTLNGSLSKLLLQLPSSAKVRRFQEKKKKVRSIFI
jgi:hypothetical protein